MRYSEKLKDEKLFKQVFEIVTPLAQRSVQEIGGLNSPYIYESKAEQYAHLVFLHLVRIMESLEQLEFIPVFLKRFPARAYYEKNGISRPKFIDYHLRNFYIKRTTISDQCVLLINELYELGNDPKTANFQLLKKNRYTKSTQALALIQEYEKIISDSKRTRNLIVHRGEFYDKAVSEMEMIQIVHDAAPIPDTREITKEEVTTFIQNSLQDKLPELETNIEATHEFLEAFFDELHLEFQKRYKLKILKLGALLGD